ncbi:ATP-binding cassette domain-containing protein [Rathayibacter sp. VKM Ac-2762]|uniref:ATP-binding cassette domain-containing protein n=1 Tax=Rathayibacter sp. VKM Ac-2762 TaxID=2609254 RepID=UPI00132EFC81|nr:ATP-binding cassette domain-containing protein [Rathayibacter sp. VKM Ac-2762]QHF21620.1 ATP-binding cassette domain-containing protein [Rathayibacter sp. VKM Ac-2762]
MRTTVRPRLQLSVTECGPRCAQMILDAHGIGQEVGRLAPPTGTSGGMSLAEVAAAIAGNGLPARVRRVPVAPLSALPAPSVLFWDGGHFVVLERVGRRRVVVVDPAVGRLAVDTEEFSRRYGGVLVEVDGRRALLSQAVGAADRARRALGWNRPRTALAAGIAAALHAVATAAIAGGAVHAWAAPAAGGALAPQHLASAAAGAAVGGGLLLAHALLLDRTVDRTNRSASRLLSEHLFRLPLTYFSERAASEPMLRLSSAEPVRRAVLRGAAAAIGSFAAAAALVAAAAVVSPSAAVAVALAALGQWAISRWGERAAALEEAAAVADGQRAAETAAATIVSIAEVKASALEAASARSWATSVSAALGHRRTADTIRTAIGAAAWLVRSALVLVLLLVAGPVALGAAALGVAVLVLLGRAQRALVSLAALDHDIDGTLDLLGRPAAADAETGLEGLEHSGICADGLRPAPTGPIVSFGVPAGQRAVVSGPPGSGRSALLAMLAGVADPGAGRVLIGGRPRTAYRRSSLSRRVAYVSQRPVLPGGTITEMIRFGRADVSDADIRAAAATVELDDDVRRLRMGYETVIAPGAASLTTAQRRRVVLARALAVGPAVLLLDEATAPLGRDAEQRLLERLSRQGTTVVLVSSDSDTVARADVVIDLTSGERPAPAVDDAAEGVLP